ncbi:MAG: hypothetical protein ACLFP2_04800 [Candidatus Woesearchaeota archaeon]
MGLEIETKGMGEYVFKAMMASKVSLGLLVFSCYIGAKNHELINRLEDYILHHNVPVEQKYFSDPRGLYVDLSINDKGRREVYLVHEESGKRLAIKEDMVPSTKDIIDCLESRLEDMSYQERDAVKKTLYSISR